MKRVLILYTSVGLGHKTVAENIGFHLSQAGYKVKLHDALQLQAGALVNIGTKIHQFINTKMPFIWKWLYAHTHQGLVMKLTQGNRVKVASKNYQGIKQVVDGFLPDLVIATQTTPSAVMEYLKQQGWYKGLFAIAFSDYHLHRFWLYDSADFYLANIEEQKQEMVEFGVRAEKIFVVGMTLPPLVQVDTEKVRLKLGIPAGEKVVLVASGSLGTGLSVTWLSELANAVDHLETPTRLIIVCGKNHSLYQELKNHISNERVIVVGYYSPLAELYDISDIFITKPGGLTMAETLQRGLPLLVAHTLPGGEDLNYEYLVKHKLVMPKPRLGRVCDLLPVVKAELVSGDFSQSLISNPLHLELTQLDHEGERLKTVVQTAFHGV
jgi:processive 1,2-diacylglycerol beta-glucosyltransferase